MKKIIVLGGGLVGGPMALDLAKNNEFEVTLVDINPETADRIGKNTGIKFIQKDLSVAANVQSIVKDYDIVLSAVPGFMGFQTLKTVIESGRDVIDIAFFPEDMLELDGLAQQHNVTAIPDIGVAPGMSNVLIGYVAGLLDKVDSARTYVGGLPKTRQWPWEYKAVFSPIDVIEEYTRPARYVENGELVVKEPLTDPELMDFPGVGTLEAFNSDGLRSLITTIDAPYKIEKTLRYPGHIDKIKVLKETGFFDTGEKEVNGKMVRPIDFTTKLLFPKWKLEEGEHDITVMKVIIEGEKSGKKLRYEYDLYDEFDPETGVHSMARTTGYTATMAVRMLAAGLYDRKGVSAPEYIGEHPDCVQFILKGLKERGVVYRENIISL